MSRIPINDENEANATNDNGEADEQLDTQSVNEAAGGEGAGGPSELEQLRAERDSLFERFARAQADFQNSRKRLEAEADQRLQYANANLIKSLLPVIDNLERAMAVDPEKTDARAIIKGLQVLVDQFNKVLTSSQVQVIAPEPGTSFDPTRHEALLQQSSDKYGPNAVTQLLQKGYSLRDRTLRPAQVAVSKAG